MNFSTNMGMPFPLPLLLLAPFLFYGVGLYVLFRFLRTFEQGVQAHQRIADALQKRANPAGEGRVP